MSGVAQTAPSGAREGVHGGRATQVERLAGFVCHTRWEDVSEAARGQLKLRVLDSLGVALGALDAGPVAMVREQLEDFGGAP